jgi:hypothetical protein
VRARLNRKSDERRKSQTEALKERGDSPATS